MTSDIERVLIFRDVVRSGGFARAAKKRGTVHSTVSRQIKELESDLGLPLMTRTTRAKQLTAAGELVLRYAEEIGKRYTEMMHELERMEEMVGGELRIQSLTHVGEALVLPAVDRFVEEFPQVDVRLVFDDGPLQFHKNGLDLAVTVGLPTAEQLIVRKLCPNEVCIVAAPSLVAEYGPLTTPTDLLDCPIVAYKSAEATVLSWPYEVDGSIRSLDVHPNVTLSDGVSLLNAVRRGLGVGYLSRISAARDLERGDLVELLPEISLPPYAPIFVVRSDLRLVSARTAAFEKCLRAVAAEKTA